MSRPFTKLCDKLYQTDRFDLERINIRKDMNESNVSILRAGTLTMAAAFGGMIILSFILPVFEGNRPFYIFEAVTNAILCIAARFYLPGRERPTTLGVYAFCLLLYYAGIYVDILARQNLCTVTGCLFLGVLPLMFLDDFLRISMFSTLITAANIVLMLTLRDDVSVTTDIINITFSWFWGIYLALRINRTRLRSYINEHIIAMERDTDSMTGLWNKNYLTGAITEHITRQGAQGLFIMMDIDHFKQLNDTYGHSYGDTILIDASACVRKVFDDKAILGRFGGDEFIFYVPDAKEEQGAVLAEQLLRSLYDGVKITQGSEGLNVSLGVAFYEYVPNMTYDGLMNMADRALYVTKENGRFGYTIFHEKHMERKTIAVA